MLSKLNTPAGRKYLAVTISLFIIALFVISKVTFEGVEEQYHLPIKDWTNSMFIMQGAWVLVYSIVATFITSLPFAFYFLNVEENND
jgi:hypothetical protein